MSDEMDFDAVSADLCGQGALHGTVALEGHGWNYFKGKTFGILTLTF